MPEHITSLDLLCEFRNMILMVRCRYGLWPEYPPALDLWRLGDMLKCRR